MKKLCFTTLFLISLSVFGQTSFTGFNAAMMKEPLLKNQALLEGNFIEINDVSNRAFLASHSGQAVESRLKSAMESAQKLDSTIKEKWSITNIQWEIDSKTEYTYNDKGLVNMRVDLRLDENTNQWFFTDKIEYTYDESLNTIRFLNFNWDTNTNQWVYYSKWDYRYDSFGNRELKEVYSWDKANENWAGFYISESTFDEGGRLILNWYSSAWDNNAMQWIALKKNEYEYSTNGNYLSSNYFEKQNELAEWEWKKRREYFYDENDDLIQIKEYSRASVESEWIFTANTLYTFDTEHRTLTYKVYDWDSFNEVWKLNADHEYAYDAYDNLILSANYGNMEGRQILSMTEYQYDSDGNNLYLRSRSWSWNYTSSENELTSDYINENTYNPDGKQTLASTKNWYLSSNEWSGSKSEISYDIHGNGSQSVNYQWNNAMEVWILNDRDTYYYSDQVISAVEQAMSLPAIKTYPNPASDYVIFDVSFKSAIVDLFDIQGKKVASQELSETKQIDVSSLKRGVYFYRIVYGGESYSGKLVIK